jgi:ClpP class serine protease
MPCPVGTLIALAADEIVLGEFSVLGPIDPQIAGFPAASIVKARDSKSIDSVFDLCRYGGEGSCPG